MKITKEMIKHSMFHCDSEEKAIELLKKCHDLGYEWTSNRAYIKNDNNWEIFRENTCYDIDNGNCHNTGFCKALDYEIIEYVLDKDCEFMKGDLKAGYLVKLRNGDLYILISHIDKKHCLINKNGDSIDFEYFNNYLNCIKIANDRYEYDIIKVYGFEISPCTLLSFNINGRDLLWERKEEKDKVVEMTLEEVCKELGKEVKIIK